MARINIGKLVVGGLAAGVVGNALHFVIDRFLMTVERSDMVQRLNLSQQLVNDSFVTWIIVDLVWGFLLVFAYAAMRPRFGPGPATAAVSGATLWLAVASVFAGLTAMGVFTEQAFLKDSALNLVTTLAASLAGAALYQEA